MGKRSKARECALQVLYQWELTGEPIDAVVGAFWRIRSATPAAREMAERLARGAHADIAFLDAAINQAVEHWRLERIAAIERNILRVAAYELLREATPPAVVIDEAVEMAKRFGEKDSPGFVNGVLDGIRRARPREREPAAGAKPVEGT